MNIVGRITQNLQIGSGQKHGRLECVGMVQMIY